MDWLLLIVLLLFSAFFSGSEAAIFHLPRITAGKLAIKFPIIKNKDRLLSTILLGNTLVNTSASIIAAKLFYRISNSTNEAIITGIMTYILLVCCEFTPKFYSIGNAEKVAVKCLPIIRLIHYLFSPITTPLNGLMRLIAPAPLLHLLITREELKVLAECAAEENTISEQEKEFILRLLESKDKKVEQIMTPIKQIEALPISTLLSEVRAKKLTYSRIPVYKVEAQNIVGILYLKDLLIRPEECPAHKFMCGIKDIVRKPYFVPQSMSVSELFAYFQKNKVHIAVVIDKRKTVARGIVTLDDILNSILCKRGATSK
ncbi:MAG: HlyC/CorC family transporter [Candidatus Stahlbacteria bacterium]|nr:HlyC/CorC family transporter [Candidatus Stahlbacteria bacterium]